LHKKLTTYVYDSHIVKSQQQCRDNRRQSQVQKGGIVYTRDVDHDIAGAADRILAWQPENLDEDQKLYRLKLSYYVLPQLIVRTRARREAANRTATNLLRRATRRAKKEEKDQESDQEDEDATNQA